MYIYYLSIVLRPVSVKQKNPRPRTIKRVLLGTTFGIDRRVYLADPPVRRGIDVSRTHLLIVHLYRRSTRGKYI